LLKRWCRRPDLVPEAGNQDDARETIDKKYELSVRIGGGFGELGGVLRWPLIGGDHVPSFYASSCCAMAVYIDYVAADCASECRRVTQRKRGGNAERASHLTRRR